MDKVDSEDVYQGCKHGASSNIQNHTNMLTQSKFAAWDLQAAHTTWDIANISLGPLSLRSARNFCEGI